MKDIIRHIDRSGIREETQLGTKRKIAGELGSLVHQSSEVAPLVHILVVVGINGAAVDG